MSIDNHGEIIIYQSEDGLTNIEVKVRDETVWLTQQQMADLFQTSRTNVVEHIKHIYEEGELDESLTCQKFRQVRKEGNREVSREMPFYNLDMIISLGYRVKSVLATNFRRWATERLKEYMIKGFTMDDDFAAHGHTAAEVIYDRANAEKPFMGLTSFFGEFPALKDIGIAKNYLTGNELKILNNLVSGYFDLAEINALEHKPMYMSDYVEQLDSVLSSGNRKLLAGAGKISHDQAMRKAKEEYRKYQEIAISPVEQAYLDTIKEARDNAKKNVSK